ncbi:MAG TPA: L-threonylcarbamoyladenylate synthase [Anaeromyxobacteraceae bacterium]|nr:L-threonylcarbamoyladenylate synthase [Anaeromyxobacteraceae bacterium]
MTNDPKDAIRRCADVLRAGGLVAYPTETFYALGALASRSDALARLASAKLRPEGKPLPLLAADEEQVRAVATLDGLAARLAARFWPGPLTIVLPAAAGLDVAITAGSGTVAIRVPGNDVARELARTAGGPLISTSANLSGEPPPAKPADLSPDLLARIDAVLEARACPGGLPSTIIAVSAGRVTLLRDGAVPFREVEVAART